MTAQPVELMAFQRRIERRVMDELIRKDIVGHIHKLQKATDDQKKGDPSFIKHDTDNLDNSENQLKTRKSQLSGAEADGVRMTRVSKVNDLYDPNELLLRRQRSR